MDSVYNAYKSGLLDTALKLKIVKQSVISYIPIYETYLKYRQMGHNYTIAVEKTALAIPTSEITVKRAIAALI